MTEAKKNLLNTLSIHVSLFKKGNTEMENLEVIKSNIAYAEAYIDFDNLPDPSSDAFYKTYLEAKTIVDLGIYVEYVAPTATVASVTMRQARLALLNAGLLEAVNNSVTSMTQADQIEWEYATTVERESNLVTSMAKTLNLTESQLDEMFTLASTL